MKNYQCFACEKTSQFDGELLVCPHCGKRCLQEYDPTKIKPIQKLDEIHVESWKLSRSPRIVSDIVDNFASDETKSKLIELSSKLAAIEDENSVEYAAILEEVKTLAKADVDARGPTNKPTYKPAKIVYIYPDYDYDFTPTFIKIIAISLVLLLIGKFLTNNIINYVFYIVSGILCLTVSLIVAYYAYMYLRKRRKSEMERKAIDIPKYPGA